MRRIGNVLIAIVAIWLVAMGLSLVLLIATTLTSIHVRLAPIIITVMLALTFPLRSFMVVCDWLGQASGVSWFTVFAIVMGAVLTLLVTWMCRRGREQAEG